MYAFRSNSIPPEILQTLLNLAEFMEHDVEVPGPANSRRKVGNASHRGKVGDVSYGEKRSIS